MISGKRKIKDLFAQILIYICASFSVAILLLILCFVIKRGVKSVNWSFLTTVTSVRKQTIGIAGNIVNTVLIILVSMLIATPIGVGAAIFLNEYAGKGKTVRIIEFATEVLAGIPSIIFGLFGMLFFGETLGMGYTILTGSLTLSMMVLPLITRNPQEALKTVPDGYRSASIGLGAGKWYMIRTILIPSAMPGILTGVILSIGRIIGESAALLLTAGSAKHLPKTFLGIFDKIFQSGGTLTIQLYLSATSEGDFDTAFGIAVVLLVIVFLMNILAKTLAGKMSPTGKGR